MAEKEKTQTPEGQEAVGKDEDYKAKLAEMEAQNKAEIERLKAEIRQKEETLDAVTPYVDWTAASGQQTTTPEVSSEGEYADTKKINEQLQLIESKTDAKITALKFLMLNPDLAAYEKSLVGPACARLIESHPSWSRDKVLTEAATEVRSFLETERKKGEVEAKKKEEERQEEVDKASGLGSAKDTAPEQIDEGETNKQYIEARQKRLAQMKTPSHSRG